MIERGRKDKLRALRNVPKKKLLEETAKVDKVLSKFKTHSITKTNELFYAGAVVVLCCISSFISLSIKKLNHVLQESNKLNVPTGINAIINFYNISQTLATNITFPAFSF